MAEPIINEDFIKNYVDLITQSQPEINTSHEPVHFERTQELSMLLSMQAKTALQSKSGGETFVRNISAIENVINKRAGISDKIHLEGSSISAPQNGFIYITRSYNIDDASVIGEHDKMAHKIKNISGAEWEQFVKDVTLESILLKNKAEGKEISTKIDNKDHGLPSSTFAVASNFPTSQRTL